MTSALGGLAERPAAYTRQFTFIRGRYKIASEELPYFAVGMEVQEASNSLVLPRDVVLDPTAPIRMEELFQRELNEARSEGEIVPYLKAANQPKFFNALTVVVLPLESDERRLAHRYVSLPGRPPIVDDDGVDVTDIGPVRLEEARQNRNLGYISWDMRLARAVIVDGQHRFYAVKKLLDDPTFPYRDDLARTQLPVLLLVLDKLAGFQSANEQEASVLQTCRALFIDLNKHAKVVSKARQYLLDDRDLTAVSMRAIMADEVGASDEPAQQRVQTRHQLPLSLVDWSSGEAKFDDGLYVTTVLTLYEIVEGALDVRAPLPTDFDALKDYVDQLVARLDLDGRDDFDRDEIRKEIDRSQDRGLPFSLSNEATKAAAQGFRDSLGVLVTRPLVELTPYAALVERYEASALLSAEHEQWLGLDRAGKLAYAEEVGDDPKELASDVAEECKRRYRIAYQVVFQKAFIGAVVAMSWSRSALAEHWGALIADSRDAYVTEWVSRFNEIFAPYLASNDPAWTGAGINAAGNIVWTAASQRAIRGFVVYALIAPIDEWRGRSREELQPEVRAWLEQAWSKAGGGRPATSFEGLYKLGAPWKNAVRTYVRALLRARDELRDPTEDEVLDQGIMQLMHLAGVDVGERADEANPPGEE